MIHGLRLLALGLIVSAAGPATACEYPPAGWLPSRSEIAIRFCESTVVAVVQIREVLDQLDVPTDLGSELYGAHYSVIELLRGSELTEGFLWSYRNGATCGADFRPGEVHLVFLGRTGRYSVATLGGRVVSAGEADQAENSVLYQLQVTRELASLSKQANGYCDSLPVEDLQPPSLSPLDEYPGSTNQPVLPGKS
jgi:hypothetical protein